MHSHLLNRLDQEGEEKRRDRIESVATVILPFALVLLPFSGHLLDERGARNLLLAAIRTLDDGTVAEAGAGNRDLCWSPGVRLMAGVAVVVVGADFDAVRLSVRLIVRMMQCFNGRDRRLCCNCRYS